VSTQTRTQTSSAASTAAATNGGPAGCIQIQQIGVVVGGRTEIRENGWADETARIVLDGALLEPEATMGLTAFSHLEVIFHFHRSTRQRAGAAHPRSNPHWPRVGVLADHSPHRRNHLGHSCCELVAVDGLELTVRGLDAVDGTPVLDIKPYVEEFAPKGPVREPAWIRELMRAYY
jgi:tRNA (adenine37-N6)-methyltransferase